MKWKKKDTGAAAAVCQLRSGAVHPFGALRGYVPLGSGEERVYRELREAIPVLDAAVGKLVRLSGGFNVECENKLAQEKLNRFLLSFMRPSCLFGGIAAILIATGSSRNGGWIISTQYFGYHAILVVFSLYLYTSKEIEFKLSDYLNCLKFLLVLMFFAFYINSILYDGVADVNFMYVINPPQDGLPFLNKNQGWFVYVLKYASLIMVCVTLSYIVPIVKGIKSKWGKPAVEIAETNE